MNKKAIFDRSKIRVKPLSERDNKLQLKKILVDPETSQANLSELHQTKIDTLCHKIIEAKKNNKPIIFAFGAHVIKNGLMNVLNELIRNRFISHIACNGATLIHDWELAYQGETAEDVERYINEGQFGIWQDTGQHLNVAIAAGAYQNLGYAESIGKMIMDNGIHLPNIDELKSQINGKDLDLAARAAEMYHYMNQHQLREGLIPIKHPFNESSLCAKAYSSNNCITSHPMYGHDIIYTHKMTHGPSIGRCADIDFLRFAKQIEDLDGGVYISLGSAIMSPMIFEKAFSMAQNIAISQNKHISEHSITVVDLADAPWDWKNKGEPPSDHPAYYLRFMKTFHRMGGDIQYIGADHKDVLLYLCQQLVFNS